MHRDDELPRLRSLGFDNRQERNDQRSSRTLDNPTATAVSMAAVPLPSAVTRMTCAGPAHWIAVDSIAHPTGKP